MAIGAAHVGVLGTAESEGASRELAAIGRASEWLNSSRLTPESLAGKVGARPILDVHLCDSIRISCCSTTSGDSSRRDSQRRP